MRSRLTFAGLTLAASAALACGQCTDTVVTRAAWWLMAGPALLLALGVEGALFLVLSRLHRYEPRSHRAWVTGVAAAIAVALFFGGGGLTLPIALMSGALLVAFVRSLVLERGLGRGGSLARGIVVAVGLVGGLAFAWPSHQTTARLIELERRWPRGASDDWVRTELQHRPDAIAAVEEAIEGEALNAQRLLPLHRALGGRLAFRQRLCAQLTASHQAQLSVCAEN